MYNSFIFFIITLFPTLHLFFAYLFYADSLETFCLSTCLIILFHFILSGASIKYRKIKIPKHFFQLIIVLTLYSIFDILFLEKQFSTAIISTVVFIMLIYIYTKKDFISSVENFVCNKSGTTTFFSIIYVLIILLCVQRGDAFFYEWSTSALKGPYPLCHTLAYEALSLVALNLFVYKNTKKKLNFLLAIMFSAIILLTAVRGAILAELVLLLFFFLTTSSNEKVALVFVGFFCIFLLMFNDNIVSSLITALVEKNNFAIDSGSFSNGRLEIWESSLNAFFDYQNPFKWITGIGYENLLEYNRSHVGMKIQAHNDIITIIVSYGILVFLLFMNSLFVLLKRANGFWLALFCFCLILSNGLVLYSSFVISLVNIILFFNLETSNQKNKSNNSKNL